jgi:hypothetical protein
VGYGYTGKTVYVSVDPLRREWLFRDEQATTFPRSLQNNSAGNGL